MPVAISINLPSIVTFALRGIIRESDTAPRSQIVSLFIRVDVAGCESVRTSVSSTWCALSYKDRENSLGFT